MATYNFNGALVLITGAGSGIGRSVAKAFDDSNAIVVIADINYDGAKETLRDLKNSKKHRAIQTDVSNRESIEKLCQFINEEYNNRAPQIVIHAAAIVIGHRQSIFDIKDDEWSRIMDTNLKGTFLINQIFAKKMLDEKIENASIINFASTAARVPFPIIADYCASKAGVVALTQNFAHELAPHNIRVNVVRPNGIHTPILEKVADSQKEARLAMTPMKRFGMPDEVARTCLFLASTESSYITGQCIDVSGGI